MNIYLNPPIYWIHHYGKLKYCIYTLINLTYKPQIWKPFTAISFTIRTRPNKITIRLVNRNIQKETPLSFSRTFEYSYKIVSHLNSTRAEIRSRANKRMCKANRINYGPFFISHSHHAVTCTHQSDRPLHLDSRVYESSATCRPSATRRAACFEHVARELRVYLDLRFSCWIVSHCICFMCLLATRTFVRYSED